MPDKNKKKGLGWIPEYPDLRDYYVNNEEKLRFKVEESTAKIDKITKNFIELIQTVNTELNKVNNKLTGQKAGEDENNTQSDQDRNNVQKIIDELKNEILDNILFSKVKVHSFFKYSSLRENELINKVPNKNNLYRQQILELKKYLSILVMGDNKTLNPPDITDQETKDTEEKKVDFSKPKEVVEWMREDKYDLTTKKLVIQFQKKQGIREDGIFGLETYTTLNEHFSGKDKNNFNKSQTSSSSKSETNSSSNKPLSKIRFVSVASLIPDTGLHKILDFLLKKAADSKKESDKKEIIKILRHSNLIEPMISAALNILHPLVKHKDKSFAELIDKGLGKLDQTLKQAQKKGKKDYSIKIGDDNKEALAIAAIKKVRYLLEIEKPLPQTTECCEDNDKNENRIFLCSLIEKYINNFDNLIEKNREHEVDLLDKQELFEIDYREDSELFPTLDISIPIVSSYLIQEVRKQPSDKEPCSLPYKKRYSLLPDVVDLSFWCSPVRDQGSLNSCTAFAAISLFEYFVNRTFNQKIDASPLFLYKAARQKMNLTEDVGSSIRETMKALALYGVPPENSWPYDEDNVNEEPPAYCYAYAQNYQSLKYFLLDYAGIPKETLLFQIKAVLAAGFPCIFGFTIYNSYNSADDDSNEPGHIPFPDPERDKVIGGHTVVAVGYNDYKFIQCADRKKYSQGAFLIRNSWGSGWGVKGYGWLPYDYVLAGLTAAWWSLLKSEWFNEGSFGAAGGGGGKDSDQGGDSGTGENG